MLVNIDKSQAVFESMYEPKRVFEQGTNKLVNLDRVGRIQRTYKVVSR
jgi:hypothetical protein